MLGGSCSWKGATTSRPAFVDEHVEGAEPLAGACHQGAPGAFVGDVGDDDLHLGAACAQLGGHCLELVARARGQHQPRALPGERAGDEGTEPREVPVRTTT